MSKLQTITETQKLQRVQSALANATRTVKTMTVAQWAKVPGCDRQRNSEAHLGKIKGYAYSPCQARVAMAIWPNGECKLDGHTRSLGWETGKFPMPADGKVFADVYHVKSQEVARELYKHFDNAKSVETVSDKVFGARRQYGYEYTSTALKGGINAQKRLYEMLWSVSVSGKVDEYALTKYWHPEMETLDRAVNPKQRLFQDGTLRAALLLIRAKRKSSELQDVCKFFKAWNEQDTEEKRGARNAVAALNDAINRMDNEGVSRSKNIRLMRLTIAAYDRFIRGNRLLKKHLESDLARVDGAKPVHHTDSRLVELIEQARKRSVALHQV